jgi:hypothetical protein
VIRVASIEAVGNSEAEDGGADKAVSVGNSSPDRGWGFVTV